MNEITFYRDMELSDRLSKLARDYLFDGVSVDETMQLVLSSSEYCDWKTIPRSFQINCDQKEYYEDLLGNVQLEKYMHEIDTYVNQYFMGLKTEKPLAVNRNDHVFEQLGMQVTIEQLGYEIARLSKIINTEYPLNYKQLLNLFTGTALLELEEGQLNCLLSKEEEVTKFVEEFYQIYSSEGDQVMSVK
jgi:hypothetical protein